MPVARELRAAVAAALLLGLLVAATASGALPPASAPGAAVAAPGGPGVAPVPSATGVSPPPPIALGPDPNAQSTSLSGPGPLVGNGLGSPSCRDPTADSELAPAARADCAVSGVAVAPAPLEHYQFDIHIDSELLSLNGDRLIQDRLLNPAWMAIVWLTHVAIVGLEWCFSLDLLRSGALRPVAQGLLSMRDALTTPWLAPVLALAAVALAYNGLIRRRVVDTLGQAALLLAMIAGGLWVVADPVGSVGAASQLVNEASLGALGAAATGDANHPLASLDEALRPVFDTAVIGPWCYLEFGNVAWCRDPSRLDPGLVAAAQAVLQRDQADASSPSDRRTVALEARQISAARTNGELFLALPSNGPRRNSINADASSPSLLAVLCGSDTATSCPAETGPQAEFRTQKGTSARLGGLLLIAIGALGMFALLGFICLRLLGASLLALLFLLLAPLVVLAPALGDAGRDVFRRWLVRLTGTVLAKLVYAVYLGVVLLMVRILAGLGGLGWWAQWLLIAAFWWLVFNHRHRVLENVIHERAEVTRRASLATRLGATHHAVKLAGPPVKALRGAGRRGSERLRQLGERARKEIVGPRRPDPVALRAEQVSRTLERDHADAVATLARSPALELDLSERRLQRERLRKARQAAVATGDRRGAVSLQRRQRDVEAEIDAAERTVTAARAAVPAGEERRRQTGLVHDAAQRERRAELLDREAEVRPRLAARSDPRRGRRDYAGLEKLLEHAGGGSVPGLDYASLSAGDRRRMELAIDRELESRRAWAKQAERTSRAGAAWSPAGKPQPPGGDGGDRAGGRPLPAPPPLRRRERQFDRRRR